MSAERRTVLVTGASGFVGSALLRRLDAHGVPTRAAAHRRAAEVPPSTRVFPDLDVLDEANWSGALSGCDVVVHTAARVHVMRDASADPLADYRCMNVDGTLRVATLAARAGVRRFVFLSSIKVNGERTMPGRPFTASDEPAPADPYAISKWEAERALRALASESGLDVVVVRPPLVYGPGVRANFRSLVRWLARGVPLPFGAIDNRRSLVGIRNLADFLARCTLHPAAAGRTLLVSDGDDLSTPELARRIAAALGRRARLIAVPPSLLRAAAAVVGRRDAADRLVSSLQVDLAPAAAALQWTPPHSVDEELRATAEWFLATQRGGS